MYQKNRTLQYDFSRENPSLKFRSVLNWPIYWRVYFCKLKIRRAATFRNTIDRASFSFMKEKSGRTLASHFPSETTNTTSTNMAHPISIEQSLYRFSTNQHRRKHFGSTLLFPAKTSDHLHFEGRESQFIHRHFRFSQKHSNLLDIDTLGYHNLKTSRTLFQLFSVKSARKFVWQFESLNKFWHCTVHSIDAIQIEQSCQPAVGSTVCIEAQVRIMAQEERAVREFTYSPVNYFSGFNRLWSHDEARVPISKNEEKGTLASSSPSIMQSAVFGSNRTSYHTYTYCECVNSRIDYSFVWMWCECEGPELYQVIGVFNCLEN